MKEDYAKRQWELACRIKYFRILRRLTQKQVAESIGIARCQYAQMELGNRSVSALELEALSNVLSITMESFLSVPK